MLMHMEESETGQRSAALDTTPEELLTRTAQGDGAAFEALYDAVSPMVYGVARRIVVDPELASDVAQEVFVELWQHAARYDRTRGSALPWIATIAHRRAVDRVRSANASRNRDLREGIRDYQESHDDVEDLAIVHADAQRARQALETLPDAQRQAISLAYYEGLTQHEVAERLGVPLGTVKTRIRDGLKRLRNGMGVA